MGTIRTYQRCPRCDGGYPSSKGLQPIQCCLTQPTKFFIQIWHKGRVHHIYVDDTGRTLHDFAHAAAVLGKIRTQLPHFDPEAYRKNSKTAFSISWKRFIAGYKNRPGTRDKLIAVGRQFEAFQNRQIRDIGPLEIDDWWRDLNESGLSERYQNDILSWLKSAFKQAHELGVIKDQIRRWPKPHVLPGPDVDDWLTLEEQRAVLTEISAHDRPVFEFLLDRGAGQ